MKTKLLLSLFLMAASFPALATTWTVTNSGNTFSPNTITINLGDSVQFVITSNHNVLEVSQATWNANGATALPGGFSTPFGGGYVVPAFLTSGTHYYVCVPHASFGMKGIIIVNNTASIATQAFQSAISIYPNPSNGKFQLQFVNSTFVNKYNLEITDLQGQQVYKTSELEMGSPVEIDLSNISKGIYLLRVSEESTVYTRKIVVQ